MCYFWYILLLLFGNPGKLKTEPVMNNFRSFKTVKSKYNLSHANQLLNIANNLEFILFSLLLKHISIY